MREILFRGKNEKTGKWAFGVPLRCSRRTYIVKDVVWNYDTVGNEHLTAIGEIQVDPDTVGQFTGLLDKNGNKIFEGDIIKDKYIPEGKDIPKDKFNHIWLVTYERGAFCITNGHRSGTLFEPYAEDEIIGNKWDNPELLAGDGE